MNERLPNSTNPEDEQIAEALGRVAEQTHANAQFSAELEERLRNLRQPKSSRLALSFKNLSPAIRWAALMILLAVALSWSIRTLIPAPQPSTQNTPFPTDTATPASNPVIDPTATPIVDRKGQYDWRDTKLSLVNSLPDSPVEAKVYTVQSERPATIEYVRALAAQFGMQGEIFESEPEPNAPSAFSVVDGNQHLNVRSDRYFEYIPDDRLTSESRFSLSNPNAEAIIDEFMRSHHFDFPYKIEPSELYQAFYVQALTPDGFPIHHEFFGQNGLLFRLNENQIVSVSASLLEYEEIGTYGIKSAEEAFQQVVASTDYNGMIEGVHSSGTPPQRWQRDYPLNETVTLYSWLYASQSVNGQELRVSLDRFPAKGNLVGAEKLGKITLVKATGQFTLENGSKVFNVDSWEVYKRDDHGFSGKDAFFGNLQKQGNNVVVVSENGTFIMPDVPVEVPLPLEKAYVFGVTVGDVFEWEGIEYAEIGQGGGGGGSNGMGFYRLNLSGSPVPFPTSTPQPGTSQGTTEYVVQENDTLNSIALNLGITVDELKQMNGLAVDRVITGQTLIVPNTQLNQSLIGQRLEGIRGSFVVTIYHQADGTQRAQYGLTIPVGKGPFGFAILEGDTLKELHSHNNLPLDVWGAVESIDPDGTPVIHVERYEIPFPDLQIQLLRGKQKMTELEGQQAVLFTTEDGTVYAQMMAFNVPDTTILGVEGDDLILEALSIPGETFGGYPTLRWFSGAMATNPKNSQITEMTVTANQPYIVDETENGPATDPLSLLTASIETVELVYYVPDTHYTSFDETSDAQYIQPAWRFYGHYNNGDEFEILIQALKQEYLLPELVPFTRPG